MTDIDEWTNAVHVGDALDLLIDLPENSADAVVADPPYGLNFMPGKTQGWDDFDPKEYQDWCRQWGGELLRVIKPGGHMIAFSGNRTHHRLFSGIEDAGFTIRDTITWHFGGAMPKGMNVAKAIDGELDAEGEYGEPKSERHAKMVDSGSYGEGRQEGWERDWMDDEEAVERTARTYIPETEEAQRFDGFRTGLKPATEFAALARAPLAEDTIARNVIEYGTGALNVGDTRIDYVDADDLDEAIAKNPGREDAKDQTNAYGDDIPQQAVDDSGRYPANLVLDADAARRLDEQAGETRPGHWTGEETSDFGEARLYHGAGHYGGTGGPSRFFYCSKASTAERTLDGMIDNDHPTVKPLDLMEWLVLLVTAEGQTVLDPFAGSGTTLAAAKDLGREFVGIEIDERYADIARARAGIQPENPSHVRPGEDGQSGLEQFAADGGGE